MTQTDYLLVLASIIIGLAIAELLRGLGMFLRAGRDVQRYWIHSLTGINAFFFLIDFWWSMWGWRGVTGWTPLGLMVLIGGVTALYLLCHLWFPEQPDGVELRDYYYRQAPQLWLMVAVYMALALVAPSLVLGEAFELGQVLPSVGGLVIMLVLASTPKPVVHGVLVTVVTGVNLVFLFL